MPICGSIALIVIKWPVDSLILGDTIWYIKSDGTCTFQTRKSIKKSECQDTPQKKEHTTRKTSEPLENHFHVPFVGGCTVLLQDIHLWAFPGSMSFLDLLKSKFSRLHSEE